MISVDHYFRSHQTPKMPKIFFEKHFTPKQIEHRQKKKERKHYFRPSIFFGKCYTHIQNHTPLFYTLIRHFHVIFFFIQNKTFISLSLSLSLNIKKKKRSRSSSLSCRRLKLKMTESGRPATASRDMDDWERWREYWTMGSGRPRLG
jgi:hypothetical protein